MDKKKIILGAVAVLVIIAAVVCLIVFGQEEKTNKKTEETTTNVEKASEAEPADMNISFLTGEKISKKRASRRPIALMYNNIENAIPHSGISSADVLYESPVEGGITRIMAIFDNYDKLTKMGSVRSCRIYYCRFALEWDAIYCHYGQSKYALDFLKSDAIDNVGSYNAGNYYYRTTDRVAPHNCFTSGKQINEAIKALGYRKNYEKDYSGKFQFTEPDTKVTLEGNKKAETVKIGYNYNTPVFEFNKKDGQYYRSQFGAKHIDDQNNEQLHCSNIIIQFVKTELYPDGKSLNMTLTGTGEGWFITNGKAQKVKWEKKDKDGQTKYYDANGKEILLNTGKTWICMVQNEYSDNVGIK